MVIIKLTGDISSDLPPVIGGENIVCLYLVVTSNW